MLKDNGPDQTQFSQLWAVKFGKTLGIKKAQNPLIVLEPWVQLDWIVLDYGIEAKPSAGTWNGHSALERFSW